MCGFGMDFMFKVAIFVIVVLVILAILRAAFGSLFVNLTAMPYWNIIQLLIGGAVAIVVIMILWRFAQCAGVMHGALPMPLLGSLPFRLLG